MFRILLTYQDREASVVSIAQNLTLEQLRQVLLGPQPVLLPTATTPLAVDTTGAVSAIIQTVYGNKVTKTDSIDFEKERIVPEDNVISMLPADKTAEPSEGESWSTEGVPFSPSDEAPKVDSWLSYSEPLPVDVPEGASSVVIESPKTEETPVIEPSIETIEAEPENVGKFTNILDEPQVIQETKTQEVVTMGDEANKEQGRFVSFRETIKGLNTEEDSWEAQIVEKKKNYITELQEIASVLDDKLVSMKEFKKEQLG